MKIRCILVDDEANNLETLELLLSYIPEIEVIGTFTQPENALHAIVENKPDILFLDINMPRLNGFDLLNTLPNPELLSVIFVTAHSDQAIRAFKVNATDYLLKPIVFSELKDAVQKVKNRLNLESNDEIPSSNSHSKRLSLPTSKGFELVTIYEIIRCHGTGSYTDFYLLDQRKIVVSKNIGEYEPVLNEKGFYRVHASHIINPTHAIRYLKEDGGYVVMKDGAQVPVSRRKKNEILKMLLNGS